MDKPFTIDFKGNYLFARHSEAFEITPESMEQFWAELHRTCDEHHCYNVLIVGPKPQRRMDTIDAFDSGSRAAEISPDLSLAICLESYETDDLTEFFETVARNRGVRVGFFSDQSKAVEWLGVVDDEPRQPGADEVTAPDNHLPPIR